MLQEHLATDAVKKQMPVIGNVNIDLPLGRLMSLVLDAVGSLEERA